MWFSMSSHLAGRHGGNREGTLVVYNVPTQIVNKHRMGGGAMLMDAKEGEKKC